MNDEETTEDSPVVPLYVPPRIVEMIQTCEGYPSQWEGLDEEGNQFYFRYRWGALSVSQAPPDQGMDPWASPYFYAQVGGRFDGHLSYDRLKKALYQFLTLPERTPVLTYERSLIQWEKL